MRLIYDTEPSASENGTRKRTAEGIGLRNPFTVTLFAIALPTVRLRTFCGNSLLPMHVSGSTLPYGISITNSRFPTDSSRTLSFISNAMILRPIERPGDFAGQIDFTEL